MRILLINSNGPYNDWKEYEMCPPFSLALIANVLDNFKDVSYKIIDANIKQLTVDKLICETINYKPDLIGITFLTPQADFAYEYTVKVKENKNLNDCKVIHGGVHPQLLPDLSFKSKADYCFTGSNLSFFSSFIENYQQLDKSHDGIISRIDYCNNNYSLTNVKNNNIELNTLIPYWEYFPLDKYSLTLHLNNDKALPIFSSIGCPKACDFCCIPEIWNRKVILREPYIIIKEMKRNIELFNINKFHFYDDDFLLSTSQVDKICTLLQKENLNIQFIFESSINSIIKNKKLLPRLKEVGCIGVELGIESGHNETLKNINKLQSQEQIINAINIIHESGLLIACYMVLCCLPGETIKRHRLANDFLCKLTKTEKVFIGHYVTPFPGSALYKKINEYGINLADTWSEYIPGNITFIPNSLLNEIPILNIENLEKNDILLLSTYNHRLVNSTKNSWRLLTKFPYRIKTMINLIDGKNSVKEIVRIMNNSDCSLNIKESYRFVIRYIIILAQCGLIRTKDMQLKKFFNCSEWYLNAKKNPNQWYNKNKQNLYFYNDLS